MATQLCECAGYDWSGVDLTLGHHPECTAQIVQFPAVHAVQVVPIIRDVDHLRLMMEQRIGARGPSTQDARAVTGDPYVTLAIGGVVKEGEAIPLLADSEQTALDAFWLYYCHYVDRITGGDLRGFVLYWREFPNFLRTYIGYHALRARLLISDKWWGPGRSYLP